MFILRILSVIAGLLLVNMTLAADPNRRGPGREHLNVIHEEDEHETVENAEPSTGSALTIQEDVGIGYRRLRIRNPNGTELEISDYRMNRNQAGQRPPRSGEISRQAQETAPLFPESSGRGAPGSASFRVTILQGKDVTPENDDLIAHLPPEAIVCGKINHLLMWILDGVPHAGRSPIRVYKTEGNKIKFPLWGVLREVTTKTVIILEGNTIDTETLII